jgi:hypothetical protein
MPARTHCVDFFTAGFLLDRIGSIKHRFTSKAMLAFFEKAGAGWVIDQFEMEFSL